MLTVSGIVAYFSQAPVSYLQYPTLPDAYSDFTIQVTINKYEILRSKRRGEPPYSRTKSGS